LKTILITGGAGFIGINAAHRFISSGWDVTVLDNLSRRGAKKNLEWLKSVHTFEFVNTDIRNAEKIDDLLRNSSPDVLLHLAGQVAVTSSVENPRDDFDINARGTLNLLEAVRRFSTKTFFINASTNKVYGKMDDLKVNELEKRYEYKSLNDGVNEDRALDFHSPYGCSKGVADQYCIDYSRIFGLRTVSFRQSCIYGPRQFGVEDQGWVAWFIIANVLGKPITVYGDGKQIRDVLYVDDLIQAYELAIQNKDRVNGHAFNIGGGQPNTLSLIEFITILEAHQGARLSVSWSDWRPGDQKVFVCDIRKARDIMGWQPVTSVKKGLATLIDWTQCNKALFL